MAKINTQLLDQIDRLKLGRRILDWKQAVSEAGWKLFAEREKYTVLSWRESEGEDIQLRRARLFKKVVENVDIRIHDYDMLAGRLTPSVIGCMTSIDVCGDYIPGIWNDSDQLKITMDANVGMDRESIELLRDSAREFRGKTAPDMAYKAWRKLMDAGYGTWKRPS
ncbi:MAG: pyruvate formate lyase family protein [Acidobacteriota bacterium]